MTQPSLFDEIVEPVPIVAAVEVVVKRRPRMHKKAALRHARLGLLAADYAMRTELDPVAAADARTSRDDFRVALDILKGGKR